MGEAIVGHSGITDAGAFVVSPCSFAEQAVVWSTLAHVTLNVKYPL